MCACVCVMVQLKNEKEKKNSFTIISRRTGQVLGHVLGKSALPVAYEMILPRFICLRISLLSEFISKSVDGLTDFHAFVMDFRRQVSY